MTDPKPLENSARTPWYFSRPVIVIALFCYPVGLFLLYKSPRPRRWEKIAATIGFLPGFAIAILFALRGYWDFGGNLSFRDFRIDFGKGWWQSRKVEQDRLRQREARPDGIEPSAEFAHLSWPDFRGPRRDGVTDNTPIRLDWKNVPPTEMWRQPVGEGYASFSVGRGRAYTIEQRGDEETIACYDIATGHEVWTQSYAAAFEETLGGNGPRATPTLAGGRLYSLGATGELVCLEAAGGQVVWRTNILTAFGAENLAWGMSSSPLVRDGLVIVTHSGIGSSDSLLAYDTATGKLKWKSSCGLQSYSSPMSATILNQDLLLNFAGKALHAVRPDSGAPVWSFPWITEYDINVAQPLCIDGDKIFVSSGYDHGCALFQIEEKDGRFAARELWSSRRMKNKFTSSVIHEGHVYGLHERILACLDLATGERKWRGGRYNYGSVLLTNGHLLVLGEQGQLVLVKADPDGHKEVGQVQILEGRTWNNHVLVGGLLIARNHKEMVCYDLRVPAQSQ